MGIDRIGKGGPLVPAAPSSPAAPSAGAGSVRAPFKVADVGGRAPVAGLGAAAGASGAGPLEQLQSGSINVGQYLDLKVAEATAHLSFLPPAELRTIQGALRERLASDPALVDLAQTAGRVASPDR